MSNLRGPQLGDWCDETDDCADEDSKLECRNQQCVCRDGFEYSDGFCKRSAGAAPPEPPTLGNWCEDSADCEAVSPLMECRDALCECTVGYVALNGTCSLPSPSHGRSLPGLPAPQPGDPCEEADDCALPDTNLECRGGVCICKDGYTSINGTCQTIPAAATTTPTAPPAPKVGDPCEETMDCTEVDKNLECRINRCECKDGHHLDGELCKPQPKTDPPPTRRPSVLGDWCFQDEDCGAADANTECFGGVCLCKQGYVPENGRCDVDKPPVVTSTTTSRPRPQKPPHLGDWCLDDLDCALTDDNMECFSEVCLCRQGYVQREGLCKKEINTPMWSGEKDVMSKVGGLCEERTDCPPEDYVECRRGYCECVDGYFESEGKCRRKIAKIGAACNEATDVCYLEDDDGDVKTACVQGKCQCKQGFFLANGRCKKRINELGARCNPDRHICILEADGNDTKTECRDETCRCKEGFEESAGICITSVYDKELGASCENDRGCSSISHAKCNDGKCICKEGYGPMNNRNCGKRVGDRCDDGVCDALNTQCTKRSTDRNEVSVCVCKRLHLSSSNRTYCYTWPTSIGDLCDQTPYCKFLGEHVECIQGRCLCRENFAFQNGICVEKVHLSGK
ncbi:hypothetical protein R5R35_007823 [Gryllus longicercus]